MKPRILVVEDEPAIRMGLCDVLAYHGWAPHGVERGDDGLRAALEQSWDLLVLDVMLPEIDGFTICRRVRQANPRQAILMLTAKGSEGDVLEGFEAGADDYVTKPFSVAQVVARVRALLRRAAGTPARSFEMGPLHVDVDNLRIEHGASSVDLTVRDVELLTYLAGARDRAVSRDELLREVWGYARTDNVETRAVDMQIAKLRKKLAELTEIDVIETVRGIGYRVGG